MAIRLIEVTCQDSDAVAVERVLDSYCRQVWQVDVPGVEAQLSGLVDHRRVENLLAELGRQFGGASAFRAMVMGIEAVVPLPGESAPPEPGLPPPTALERFFSRDRLSTDEIYDDLAPSIEVRPAFLVMAMLSALIAALGMRAGNAAVVIGAMVIAPLLAPSIGLALASTVGDPRLGRRAATTLAAGILAALLVSVLVGRLVETDFEVHELQLRASVRPADVALALASGMAGVLAFARGRALSLVGVMIAVALVPPLAAAGLFLAGGRFDLATGAAELFATNLISVNLAGIATFLLIGLPPKDWRMTAGIIGLWAVLLGLFTMAMIGWGHFL